MKILLIGRAMFMAEIWDEVKRAGSPAVMLARCFCLDQALEALRGHYDGVICQQSFPTHLDRGVSSEPSETQAGNWAAVSLACRERGIPLVLVVTSERIFDQFNGMAREGMGTWPGFAFLDPVDPRMAAEALCNAIRIFTPETAALPFPAEGGCRAEVEKVR